MTAILLDENVPHKLRQALSGFDPMTVSYMGWAGLKNGELLAAAEATGFEVLVTGEKTVQFEQNMKRRKIAVVSLSAPHWHLVKDHVPEIALAITAATPGSFQRVECGNFRRRKHPYPGPSVG